MREFIVTINGERFVIVDGMAVTTSGYAYPLEDQPQDRWSQ